MVEKARNVEAKANFQPLFYVREIYSKYPKGYYLSVKKDKKHANWEYHNEASSKDKKKTKSHNPSPTNQPQAQASKKRQGWRRGPSATGVNNIKIAKKDRDKAKDLSYVKYYTCKQKDD